jgi:hypothetical protein
LLMLICLAVNDVALGQANAAPDGQIKARPEAKKACPFTIVGMWRSASAVEMGAPFLSFSPDGWVTLLNYAADALPQDFEMVTQVTYKLDTPIVPKHIQFTSARGNDVFPAGTTSMEIAEYGDDSFTLIDPASGQKTQYIREQIRRYFLTFAARRGAAQTGGPVFAMWTVMDGRTTKVDALGVQPIADNTGNLAPVFGPIPTEFCDRIVEESDREIKSTQEDSAFLRLELTAAEFATTQEIYASWSKRAKNQALPFTDAYLNGLEFLKKVAESLNSCAEKVKLLKPTQHERDEIIAQHRLPQYVLTYVQAMRKQNDELHVNNAVFPWQWRPMIQMPGQ